MKNTCVLRVWSVAVRSLLAATLVLALVPLAPAAASEADESSTAVDADAVEADTVTEEDAEAVAESADAVEETAGTVSLDEVAAALDFSSLASSEELAEGYITSVFYDDVAMGTASSSLSTQASYGASCLSGDALDLYTQLYEFVGTVAAQGGTTEFTYAYEYSGMGSLTSVGERACSALELDEVFLCLLVDCPYSLYWFDKTVGLAYFVGSGSTSGRTSTITSLSFCFTPAEAYAGSSTYSVDETKARSTTVAAANAAQIVADYAGETSVQAKLTAYKDEICALASYDEEADDDTAYGDIWQLVYVFDGDASTNVVCEGYSKAFQYLCDLTWPDNDPVTCYTVTGTLSGGTGSGGHMWNLVALSGTDGSYLVDVTNSDEGAVGEDGELFLASGADATGSASEGYVFTLSSMRVSYVYDSDTLGLYGSYTTTTSGSGPGGRGGLTQQVYSSDILTLATTEFEDVTEDAQQLVAVPAAAQGLVYSGARQTGVAASALYTVSGGTATDAGTYTATLSLVDPDSYAWVGTASSEDVQVSWVISAASLKSATLSKKSYVYKAGKKRKPSVTVKGVGGKKLSKGSDYTLAYASGRTAIGSYTVTVTGTGNYTGSIVKTFKIKPGKVTLKSAKASTASGTLAVKWKKLGGKVRYRIAYRVKGAKSWKRCSVSAGTVTKVLAKLESGKRYQVKVRAYKNVDGTTYKGAWSKVKTATVK